MKSFYKTLLIAAITLGGIMSCGATTPNPRDMHGPLPFMPYGLARQDDGLVRKMPTVANKRLNVPTKVSTEGCPELWANSMSKTLGYGMVSMTANSELNFKFRVSLPSMFGGAVYVNGKYYGCDYDYDSSYNLTYVKWYVYDATTWHQESVTECPLDFTYIATDRTYDATTGKVYSIVFDKTGNSIWLSTTDLHTGAPTMIAQLEEDVITIAADATGQLYGIDTAAKLWRIDKATAALTLVGATNIYDSYESDYTQSITIDTTTGKLYWAEFHAVGLFTAVSNLFEVNTANAQTVKLSSLPDNPELSGLFVAPYVKAGVPMPVTDLKAVWKSTGSTSVAFSMETPSLTIDGAALDPSKEIEFEIEVDGELIDLVSSVPGVPMQTDYYNFARGLHTLKVTPSSSIGSGETVALMFYAGYDVPAAPSSVKLVAEGRKATVTWNVPATGAEGGAISGITGYRVVRHPDGVTVADGITTTTYSETLSNPGYYTYGVSALSAEGVGAEGLSNGWAIAEYSVPYSCTFDNSGDMDMFTIVDVAGTGKVWNYDDTNKCARHPWSGVKATDDYLVWPSIVVDASKSYTVSFDAWQMVDSYPEHLELWMGSSSDVASMTKLMDTGKLPTSAKTYQVTMAPSWSGPCYLALRANEAVNGFMSYADNFKVAAKGSSAVPAAVSGLTVRGADNGVLAMNVEFDAPSTSMAGAKLDALTRIDIVRGSGNEVIKSFDNATPGSHISWQDTSVAEGRYTYRVTAYGEGGASESVSATGFAGVDVPNAVTALTLTNGDGGLRDLSWTAPTEGANGGNMTGVVTYRVARVVNSNSTVVAEGIKVCTFSEVWNSDEQAMAYYSVTAVTKVGESAAVSTKTFAVGDAYRLPFKESFAGGKAATAPWGMEMVKGTTGGWSLATSGENPYIAAQDNDKGVATFEGYHSWAKGTEARLTSPVINISEYTDPTLVFYMYHFNGSNGWWDDETSAVNEKLQVEISVDGGDYQLIPGGELASYAATSGWQKHQLSLAKYVGASGVKLAWHGVAAGCFNMHVDNISVTGTIKNSGVDALGSQESAIVGVDGGLSWSNVANGIEVFDMAGRLVARSSESCGSLSGLASGVYLVRAAGVANKVMVK